MHNLVAKFTPAETEAIDDEGVVGIEYVIVAGAVALGLAGVFAAAWGPLTTKLTDIIGGL
jgi:Flp pilus assembly pilin Flp